MCPVVIPKVSRGWRIYGLVAYLMGPGRFNEHSEQHVIASWDGAPETHQPPAVGGPEEFDVSALAMLLSQPAMEAGVSLRNPTVEELATGKLPQGPVWHCSLRNHESDRVLTDQEWAATVADVLDATGIARHGDEGGCRWVAIRHAEDHVHIAAVLVREDTGKRVYPRRDWNAAMEVCRAVEVKLGLTPTEKSNRTAVGQASRAELEKAARRGLDEPPRMWLRRVARFAAVAAHDAGSFYDTLSEQGVLVAWRRTTSGVPTGVALAAPGDVNAAGAPVWFAGSTLASDLSLPKLQARWASRAERVNTGPNQPADVDATVARAIDTIGQARSSFAAHGAQPEAEGPDGIVHAAEDMLIAVCEITRPLAAPRIVVDGAADVYQRAARQPGVGQPGTWGPIAADLRFLAHQLLMIRTAHGRIPETGAAGAALVVALAGLLAEISAYHEQRQCMAQAHAARSAGTLLQAPPGRRRPPRGPGQGSAQGQRPETGRTRRVAQPPTAGAPTVRSQGPPSPGLRR
jgi:hypothetical protein